MTSDSRPLQRFRRSGSLAIAVMFIAHLTTLMASAMLQPLLPCMVDQIYAYQYLPPDSVSPETVCHRSPGNETYTNKGTIIGVFGALGFAVQIPIMPIMVYVIDKLGHRISLVLSSVVTALGCLAVAFAQSLTLLGTGRILQGVGGDIMEISGLAFIGTRFVEAREKNRAIAIAQQGNPVGTLLSYLLGSFIFQFTHDYTLPFVIMAGVSFGECILRCCIEENVDDDVGDSDVKDERCSDRTTHTSEPEGKTEDYTEINAEKPLMNGSLKLTESERLIRKDKDLEYCQLLANPRLLVIFASYVLMHMSGSVADTTVPYDTLFRLDAEEWELGVILALTVLCQVSVQFVIGHFGLDIGLWMFVPGGLFLAGIGFIVHPSLPGPWFVLLTLVMIKVGQSSVTTASACIMLSEVDKMLAKSYDRVFGIYTWCRLVGIALGSTLGGILLDAVGMSLLFWTWGTALSCLSLMGLALRRSS